MMVKRYEVRSDRDNQVAFDADSVDRVAALRRTTPLKAARLIAFENADDVMGETLEVHPA